MGYISGTVNKHYHFIGIGGIGMAGLAFLLMSKGYTVSGSDVKESPLLEKLRGQGARIFIGHQGDHARGADFVIYSSAIAEDNAERVYAIHNKIPLLKRAQLLSLIIGDDISVTVAGAHGKTTTTSMVGQMLLKAGWDPTIAVGGIVNSGAYNASLGKGKYFVAEVDESDGSFLYFSPHFSIITNIDFEHIDYYHNWENILAAYKKFIDKTHPQGCILGCGEDKRLAELLTECKRSIMMYGISNKNDIYAENITLNGCGSSFDCMSAGKKIGTLTLSVPGQHNILNALACAGVGLKLGIDFETIASSLKEFTGVQRRFQIKAKTDDILVVDDYGHHPTEIKATLNAARCLNPKRLVVAFQPHRYSRTKFLFEEFIESLSLSDYLIITDIYAASEQAIPGVSAATLYEKIKKIKNENVIYLPKEEITRHLLGMMKTGDLILTLGAGDITKISDEISRHVKDNHFQTT